MAADEQPFTLWCDMRDHPALRRMNFGHPAWRFALASLGPALALVVGAVLGGGWAVAGFLCMTLILAAADRLARGVLQTGPLAADIWTDRLALGLGGAHFLLLAFALFALTGGTGLGFWGWIFSFLGFGLWLGQVSNPLAHELIHKTARLPYGLGVAIFTSILYGHHVSAHRLVHHRFVATPDDPNSATAGEGFYTFLVRAWPGEFIAGYEMERGLRDGRAQDWRNPYLVYLGGALAGAVLIAAIFGLAGLAVWLMLAAHAQVQLLLSDYVQHYGLLRARVGQDDYAAFGPEHSWDAPDVISGLMMLHAPRHADHHLHPARAYPALELSPGGKTPLLPWSLPVMATIALVPPLWRRLIDPRLARLRAGQ